MPPIAIMVILTVGMNSALESPGSVMLQSMSSSTLDSTTDSILDSSTYSTIDGITSDSALDSMTESTLGYVTASAPQTVTIKARGWDAMATSQHYINSKLVLESDSPFRLQYVSQRYSEGTARMVCSKICVSDAKCQAFNLYPTNSHFICEYLHENFCFPRQRMALQAHPGGTVWDKLQPGMTRACLDQKFATQANMTHCDIGRFGCKSVWPNCDTCVKTCNDCKSVYAQTGYYNCTLWPEDAFHPPIFAFCLEKATYVIRRLVNFSGQGNYARPDYLMSFLDMFRLSNLQVYMSLDFYFKASDGTKYFASYQNFVIDSSGTLMNMTYKSGSDDGFKIGKTPLKPSIWVKTSPNSYCGSFWLLNSTQGSASTLDCPGGGVNMFGEIYADNFTKRSGIRWPKATAAGKTLFNIDVKMNL